jgi:hypothetical protein
MHHRTRRVAVLAALLALLAVLPPAGAARASHDPSPPYVSSSQPGGYPLFGFHHDQLSPTVHAWAGLQRRSNGDYRLWMKVQGDGRSLFVDFSALSFEDFGYATYTACMTAVCTKGPSVGPIYYVGGWHLVAEEAQVKGHVNGRYINGSSTGAKCLSSYRILRGQRQAIGGPPC